MRKDVVQLNGQLQHSEKRSGFCQGGEGPNDLTRAGGLTQAKLISRKQPVRTGGGGAGLFHCLAGENLVPVRAGRGETRKNSDTLGLNNDMVATVATISSGTSGQMCQTDGQMDKVTKKQCKTRNDQMDGQVDRSNDEQCKFDVNISECFEIER